MAYMMVIAVAMYVGTAALITVAAGVAGRYDQEAGRIFNAVPAGGAVWHVVGRPEHEVLDDGGALVLSKSDGSVEAFLLDNDGRCAVLSGDGRGFRLEYPGEGSAEFDARDIPDAVSDSAVAEILMEGGSPAWRRS